MEQWRTFVEQLRATAWSERRACRSLGVHWSAVRYIPTTETKWRSARSLPHAGRRASALGRADADVKLRQEGVRDNHKRDLPALPARRAPGESTAGCFETTLITGLVAGLVAGPRVFRVIPGRLAGRVKSCYVDSSTLTLPSTPD
jgi:hypothetical protein